MNKQLLVSAMLCFYSLSAISQIEDEIKTAAQIYSYAQVHTDLDMLLDMTYPELVEKAGGPEAMKHMLSEIQKSQVKKDQVLQKLEVKDPIVFSTVAGEIHGLVPIVSTLRIPEGLLMVESTLVAIGTESRKNWYFIETTALDEGNIKKVLPNWDGSLTLPPKRAAVFKDNKSLLE